jgi:hypothetical protein
VRRTVLLSTCLLTRREYCLFKCASQSRSCTPALPQLHPRHCQQRATQPWCSFFSSRATMSFALNDSHIDGGTFNSVSGDMAQTIHSHVHIRVPADGRILDDPEHLRRMSPPNTPGRISEVSPLRLIAPIDSSIGAIRSQPVSRSQDARPYGALQSLWHAPLSRA